MSIPITQVELTHFRGSTNSVAVSFDSSKDLTLLFGENGSGKSTILDAIDVVCNETMGSLVDISVGRNAAKYLCSMGTERSSLMVTVHSGDRTWIARLQGSSVAVSGNADKPRVNILRRNKILALVTAQPHERYDALKYFIDTAVIERSEETLRLKLREIDERINALAERHTSQSDQLNEVWVAEGKPGGFEKAIDWASDKVSSGIDELSSELGDLNTVVASIESAVAAKQLHTSALAKLEESSAALDEVNNEIADSPGIDPVTSIRLIDSLSKAKEYIDVDNELSHCPTCLRDMPRDELITIVEDQLSELSQLKSLSDKKTKAEQGLERARTRANEYGTSLIQKSKDLAEATDGMGLDPIDALDISWPDWSLPEVDITLLQTNLEKVESVQVVVLQNRDNLHKDVNQYNSIKQWYNGITEAARSAEDLERIGEGLKKCHKIVHEMRIGFVDNVLETIITEANRLYQQIHPGEQINLSALKMDPSQRGSVLQAGQFHDHADVLPQAVFSESHMDTLGFCMWLALAKHERPSDTILLIDDVFTSVDNQHLQRIINLLSAEAPNFLQVIVATHFRLWWDRCQHTQVIQRMLLGQWSVINGIVVQNMMGVLEQLRQAVSEAVIDRQLISSKAGILLENILWSLSIVYRRPVPATVDNQHTLGELHNACSKLFSRHFLAVQRNANWRYEDSSESWQAVEVSASFDRVGQLQFIRNQVGCHFNEPGTQIPNNEIKEFGEATVALVEGIICPNCGFIASKPTNDGTALRCKCTKQAVRMTPATIP